MAKKSISITVTPDKISSMGISTSQNYKSAGFSAKISDNCYMNVNYDWSGDQIPDGVMELMGFMQANKVEIASVEDQNYPSSEYIEAKKGVLPPWLVKKNDKTGKDTPVDKNGKPIDTTKMTPEEKKALEDKNKNKKSKADEELAATVVSVDKNGKPCDKNGKPIDMTNMTPEEKQAMKDKMKQLMSK